MLHEDDAGVKRSPIRRISKRRQLELDSYEIVKRAVAERDRGCCILCGAVSGPPHHILPRKRGGHVLKNLCCLCLTCHKLAHGEGKDAPNMRDTRIRLFNTLQERYGYTYDEEPWSEYRSN